LFARISERFAGKGLKGLGFGAGRLPVAGKQRVEDGGSSTKLN